MFISEVNGIYQNHNTVFKGVYEHLPQIKNIYDFLKKHIKIHSSTKKGRNNTKTYTKLL